MAEQSRDKKVVATRRGYHRQLREPGEVFTFVGYMDRKPKPSWCEPYTEPKKPKAPVEPKED